MHSVGSDRSTAPLFLHPNLPSHDYRDKVAALLVHPNLYFEARWPYALGVALEVITGLMHHRPAKPSKCVSLKLDSAEVSDLSLAHSSDGQCNEGHDIYRQGIGQRG